MIEREQLDEAIACFDRALALRSDYAEAHMNRSLALLSLGDLARGWTEYEWRWRCKDSRRRAFPQPLWDGRPLEGQRIMLYAEQGLGDTIQFIRYAEQIKRQGGVVLFECPKALVRLLSTCPWVDQLIPQGEPLPAFDVQLPLLSAPAALRTRSTNIPASVPYLQAEACLVEQWRDRLQAYPGFRVGICWQGNPQFSSDRLRSIPLRHFASLASCPDVVLFSLQKHEGTEQLVKLTDSLPIVDLGPELDNEGAAFVDTAAVLQNLDLLISSDTAIVHLAGALNVPVWVALSAAADWRWLLQRNDSPWYPSMKLFRQRQLGDWQDVFGRIAVELESQVNYCGAVAVQVKMAPGELFDKISILEIKAERMRDEQKLQSVHRELAELQNAARHQIADVLGIVDLRQQLKHVNECLWDIEDEIRKLERDKDFGERFIRVARSVYKNNDERAALKRQINQLPDRNL